MAYTPPDDFNLYENINDGRLHFMRFAPKVGPWQPVDPAFRDYVMTRECTRRQFCNDLVGSNKGKTFIIVGLGPQTGRISRGMARYLNARDDICMVTANGGPAFCRRAWGLDPDTTFEFVVGADRIEDKMYTVMGWDDLKHTPKYCKVPEFQDGWIPLNSAADPSITAFDIFYHNSVTAAITLALLHQATETRTKVCAGPYCDWPEVRMHRSDGARVILVGVEANSMNHCYTGKPGFDDMYDLPGEPWPSTKWRVFGHQRLEEHATSYGAKIYQSAPWSKIQMHEHCDFEEILNIPHDLRDGVTSGGMPSPKGPRNPNFAIPTSPSEQRRKLQEAI